VPVSLLEIKPTLQGLRSLQLTTNRPTVSRHTARPGNWDPTQCLLVLAFGNKLFLFESSIRIFLYTVQAVQRPITVAFEKKFVDSNPMIGIFLYAAQAIERVIVIAFRKKLLWFEPHYRLISLRNPGSSMRASSSLRNKIFCFESHDRHIFYLAHAFERFLALAFGSKLF